MIIFVPNPPPSQSSQGIILRYSNVQIGGDQFYRLKLGFNFVNVRGSWSCPSVDVSLQKVGAVEKKKKKKTIIINSIKIF